MRRHLQTCTRLACGQRKQYPKAFVQALIKALLARNSQHPGCAHLVALRSYADLSQSQDAPLLSSTQFTWNPTHAKNSERQAALYQDWSILSLALLRGGFSSPSSLGELVSSSAAWRERSSMVRYCSLLTRRTLNQGLAARNGE